MSDTEDVSKKLDSISITDDINILLLGATGVGKSTFINAVANYCEHKNFRAAEQGKLAVLISSKFSVFDKDGKKHDITVEAKQQKDKNETLRTGVSQTQRVQTYVFPWVDGKANIRLIDTPGMGDTRGVDQDSINCEDILSYISQLHELHAICFIFKAEESRLTPYFQYCIAEILSRLDKTAARNLIFVFTSTRGSNYHPGETLASLRIVVDEIKEKPPHVEIPLNNNIFCFDNEAFRFLAALQQKVEFEDSVKMRNTDSFNKSKDNWWKLIGYIVGSKTSPPLKPHMIRNTVSVNEVRRFIIQLSQPLAEIVQHINNNIRVLECHQQDLQIGNQSLEQLKEKLYIPAVDLKIINLTQPTTVCTTLKCSKMVKCNNVQKQHFQQRCHDPCYLDQVPREIIGSPQLRHCAAIDSSSGMCHRCSCDFSVHMHIYYMSEIVESRQIDGIVEKNIKTKEAASRNAERIIQEIRNRRAEMEAEHKRIVEVTAYCGHFMQTNALTPFNDSYKFYIEYLLCREREQGSGGDFQAIKHLEKLLLQYNETMKTLQLATETFKKLNNDQPYLKPNDIRKYMEELFELKHFGKKIKEMYSSQKTAHKKEHKYSEFVLKSVTNKSSAETNPSKDPKTKTKKDFKKKPNEAPPSYREAVNPATSNNVPPLMRSNYQRQPPHGPYPPGPYTPPPPSGGYNRYAPPYNHPPAPYGYPDQYRRPYPPGPNPYGPPGPYSQPPAAPEPRSAALPKFEIHVHESQSHETRPDYHHRPPPESDPYYRDRDYYERGYGAHGSGYYPPPPRNYGPPQYGAAGGPSSYAPPPPHVPHGYPPYQEHYNYPHRGYSGEPNANYQPGYGQHIPTNRNRNANTRGGGNANWRGGNQKGFNKQSNQFKPKANKKKNPNSKTMKTDSDSNDE